MTSVTYERCNKSDDTTKEFDGSLGAVVTAVGYIAIFYSALCLVLYTYFALHQSLLKIFARMYINNRLS